jgi:hypothetical protein
MGIDIYAQWDGITKAEEAAQITGFSIEHGHAGYLREAYHGAPYVTRYLVSEAFDSATCEAAIPAAVMRDRLPAAVLMSMYREHKVYGQGDPSAVNLDQQGAEQLLRLLANIFEHEIHDESHKDFVRALDAKSLETAKRLIEAGALDAVQRSFVQFVELCERKERETGRPCRIVASH